MADDDLFCSPKDEYYGRQSRRDYAVVCGWALLLALAIIVVLAAWRLGF